MPIKKKTVKKVVKKPKFAKVDRKFLLGLANTIYDHKTKKFLHLCDGKLQNGPDPTNPKRPMHCGLGELYYAMTGVQPEKTGVGEGDVIDLAVELSPLKGLKEAALREKEQKIEKATRLVKKLDLSADVIDSLVSTLDDAKMDLEDKDDSLETQFREVLDEIPGENDDGCGDHGATCTLSVFRERSRRVADKLREAANLLPR